MTKVFGPCKQCGREYTQMPIDFPDMCPDCAPETSSGKISEPVGGGGHPDGDRHPTSAR